MECMNAVMPALLVPVIVNAASCHDQDICTVLDIKVIIDHICDTGSRNNHRYMHCLTFCLPADKDINPGLVLLLYDADVLTVAVTYCLSVLTQVISTFLYKPLAVDSLQHSGRYLV